MLHEKIPSPYGKLLRGSYFHVKYTPPTIKLPGKIVLSILPYKKELNF